ncbi:MAG: hypothetical protein FJ301_00265 [Planctomycetes bacterium]|nr:hypothetical protein [Planctomycetota bacterium]
MADTQAEYYRGLEAGGRAVAAVAPPGDPVALAAAAHAAGVELFAATVDAPPRACAAGCAHCCRFPVGVRFGEALRLARVIAATPALADAMRADAAATAGFAWEQLVGRPCPLLRDERCATYDERPMPCRALASADATACHEALTGALRGPLPRDEAAWFRGLGLAAALDGASVAGVRELRSAVAAVLTADASAAATAFLASRPAP